MEFTRICPSCGCTQTFTRKRNVDRANKNNSVCRSCSTSGEKNSMHGKTGKDSPHYGKKWSEERRINISLGQGGAGILSKDRYNKSELRTWANKIKERDGCCVYCGSKKKLEAHHIIPKSKWLSGSLLINNGITLCFSCHIGEHLLNNYSVFTFID